jgi:hypothetical protein
MWRYTHPLPPPRRGHPTACIRSQGTPKGVCCPECGTATAHVPVNTCTVQPTLARCVHRSTPASSRGPSCLPFVAPQRTPENADPTPPGTGGIQHTRLSLHTRRRTPARSKMLMEPCPDGSLTPRSRFHVHPRPVIRRYVTHGRKRTRNPKSLGRGRPQRSPRQLARQQTHPCRTLCRGGSRVWWVKRSEGARAPSSNQTPAGGSCPKRGAIDTAACPTNPRLSPGLHPRCVPPRAALQAEPVEGLGFSSGAHLSVRQLVALLQL